MFTGVDDIMSQWDINNQCKRVCDTDSVLWKRQQRQLTKYLLFIILKMIDYQTHQTAMSGLSKVDQQNSYCLMVIQESSEFFNRYRTCQRLFKKLALPYILRE